MNSPAPPCTQDHICWGAHASHPDRHRLEVDSLSVYYGSLLALNGISFSITCGHTLALMGPNGAGKSTLIKALRKNPVERTPPARHAGRNSLPAPTFRR